MAVTENPDGTKMVINRITGDQATYDSNGEVVNKTNSFYTKANNLLNTLEGTAKVGIGQLGAYYGGALQQVAINAGFNDDQVQSFINAFKNLENQGTLIRPEDVNKETKDFVQEVFKNIESIS